MVASWGVVIDGPDFEGLLHSDDIVGLDGRSPSDVFDAGTSLQVEVLEFNEDNARATLRHDLGEHPDTDT